MSAAPEWPADHVERRPLSELIPYARNTRTHTDAQVAQIAASMREWGWTMPCLVDTDGTIIAGHGRVLAAQRLGWTEAPVMVARSWTPAQVRAYRIADNRLAENSGWDYDLLSGELDELRDLDFDLDLVGFDRAALNDLIGTAELAPERSEESDDADGASVGEGAPYDAELILALAFEHYRQERGFPYPPRLPLHECMQHINRLALVDTDTLRTSTAAYHVADAYHPERYAVRASRLSPLELFSSDEGLRAALRSSLKLNGKITDAALLSACRWTHGSQCVAQFRPAFALWYLRKLCPDGGTFLDTSAGWGGRLIGFAASRAGRYVGIDPSSRALAANQRMADDLRLTKRVTLICKPAEDVDVSELGGTASCDFALTSPPYFSKEHYSTEETQSYLRYPTADGWRRGFLQPLLRLQHAALKPGAFSVINIADVTVGQETVPLAQWTIDCAREAGFELDSIESFPLPRTPGEGNRPEREEPCIVLRKDQ